MGSEITIARVRTVADYAAARTLFQAYEASLSVDLCFQDFDAELNDLQGMYRPPGGAIFLARKDNAVVGCVAMRPLKDRSAEMKRLYVTPEGRGHGIGQRLIKAVCDAARIVDYTALYIDTLPEMQFAQSLYERLGFEDTAPYNANPVEAVRFMRKQLDA